MKIWTNKNPSRLKTTKVKFLRRIEERTRTYRTLPRRQTPPDYNPNFTIALVLSQDDNARSKRLAFQAKTVGRRPGSAILWK